MALLFLIVRFTNLLPCPADTAFVVEYACFLFAIKPPKDLSIIGNDFSPVIVESFPDLIAGVVDGQAEEEWIFVLAV